MPACSKDVNPSGYEITFTENDHLYKSIINGKEVKYISGTQFLNKFFPVFDPDGKIAERCAKKENISVEEIKNRWNKKKQVSCRLGTRLHETIEDTLLRRNLRNIPEDDNEKNRFNHGIQIGKKFLQKLDILGIEKIIFSPSLKIAGTIDLFAKSKNSNCYIIIDHKTNEIINKENTFKKFCLDPISHIPDINFYHYALQLSLYEYLLKKEFYVDKKSEFKFFLNHVTNNGVNLIQVPNLNSEIKDCIIKYLVTLCSAED